MLNDSQIVDNWVKLINIINTTFTGDRLTSILKLHEDLKDHMMTSPASPSVYINACYPGGYAEHVLRVCELSMGLSNTFKTSGMVIDFTKEECVFSALFHDIGKIGDSLHPYYVSTTDNWKVKRGTLYDINPDIDYMELTDRAFFVLQEYGISLNNKEYLAVLLKDGAFKDSNKKYFNLLDATKNIKTNLPFIIHTANVAAVRIAFDLWKNSPEGDEFLNKSAPVYVRGTNKQLSENPEVDFKDIFKGNV